MAMIESYFKKYSGEFWNNSQWSIKFLTIFFFNRYIFNYINITQKNNTQDICLLSSILQDDFVVKNISNCPILNDFIKLFRAIINIDFVRKIYIELINDEIGPANAIIDVRFIGKQNF
jgi:hypothetical protein